MVSTGRQPVPRSGPPYQRRPGRNTNSFREIGLHGRRCASGQSRQAVRVPVFRQSAAQSQVAHRRRGMPAKLSGRNNRQPRVYHARSSQGRVWICADIRTPLSRRRKSHSSVQTHRKKVAMKRALLFLIVCIASARAFDPAYPMYSEILSEYVCDAGVDYAALVQDAALDPVQKEFTSLTRQMYETLGREDRIAFFANLYNFYTLKLIAGHYPVKSIKEIDKPWAREIVPLFGDSVSLDHVEHQIMRKQFDKPRIHFALNCASLGCPALRDEPYVGNRLDAQLESAAKAFLTDTARNRIEGNTLVLSKILKWYGGDFKKKYGGYEEYVKKVLGITGKVKVRFLDYDWDLNDADSCD
ncbi:MAG: DUF547 domain-containing protein [Chitinivibrionales bacterium]|nr:DUF547 domain-containing protein [Chitinivibrionales bacterium]MBD3396477.1 DUF547 domain-containing protein [Chitinivibrionales bacterium]